MRNEEQHQNRQQQPRRAGLARWLLLLSLACVLLGVPFWAAAQDEIDEGDSSTEIHVKNADLAAVIRIFSKRTKRNFILDEKVKGKVSIFLPGKISSDESLRILDSVLALKGFTSVPIGENLWKIVPAQEARQSTIPTITEETDEPASAAMVTRLVHLKNVSSEDMRQLISPLISPSGLINAYTGTNSLILIDSQDNIRRLMEIVNAVDIPSSDSDMTIIPVINAEAKDIADKLGEILGEEKDGDIPSSAADARARLRSARQAAAVVAAGGNAANPADMELAGGTVSAKGRAPKIIADERTNSIIVVADEDTTARIRALVMQLDSKVDLSGIRFYVYRCQHANAEELAEVLSGLAGGGGSSTSKSSTTGGFGENSTSSTSSLSRSQERLAGQRRTPGQSRTANQESGGVSSVNFGEDMSISADPATNSLIIWSTKTDYNKMLSLLRELDVKRRQVLVESIILEVGVTDSTELGTDFLSSTGGADGGVFAKSDFGNDFASFVADPTSISGFSVAAASAGTLTLPGGITLPTQGVLVRALESNSNVNVLSAPTILATDNEEAEIVVGQNVPFVASTSTSGDNLNNTFNTVDRQDVGITLRLTPQISSQDFVKMRIFTEVSDVIDATLASDLGPTTTVRTSETTVIAKDSQMIVIGGLITDDVSNTESGVPFLRDIPVLGHIFKGMSEAHSKTNLLIFISPKIVKDQFDARDATIGKRDILEQDIDSRQIYPDRSDVLRSPAVDHVAESEEYDGVKPTTILPPQPRQPDGGNSGNFRGEPQAVPEKGVLEFKIKPKFHNSSAAPAPAQPVKAPMAALRPLEDRYIVLQIEGKSGAASDLPFAVTQERLLGIAIPEGSSPLAKDFFDSGNGFKYELAGVGVSMKVVQRFEEASEAVQKFPALDNKWHTLSPYEIMNLGAKPWSKVSDGN